MGKELDLRGLKLDEGKVILERNGFKLGKIFLTLAPNASKEGETRIVRQKNCGDNQIDLVVVKFKSLLSS
ncbi:MAG: hypothetical protein WDA53_03340 [Bacillota bacterium]